MICPSCGSNEAQVIDSRRVKRADSIRRRRVCLVCKFRFTTYEGTQIAKRIEINQGNTDMDRRSRMLEEDLAVPTPAAGMVPVATRRFESGELIFNRGCIVPPEQIPNFDRLVKARFIEWRLASAVGSVKPIKKAASSPPRMPVEIKWADPDLDKVLRFEKTFADTVDGIIATGSDNGDRKIAESRALDAIENDKPKGEQWIWQFRIEDAERQSRRNNEPMRRIVRAF